MFFSVDGGFGASLLLILLLLLFWVICSLEDVFIMTCALLKYFRHFFPINIQVDPVISFISVCPFSFCNVQRTLFKCHVN